MTPHVGQEMYFALIDVQTGEVIDLRSEIALESFYIYIRLGKIQTTCKGWLLYYSGGDSLRGDARGVSVPNTANNQLIIISDNVIETISIISTTGSKVLTINDVLSTNDVFSRQLASCQDHTVSTNRRLPP